MELRIFARQDCQPYYPSDKLAGFSVALLGVLDVAASRQTVHRGLRLEFVDRRGRALTGRFLPRTARIRRAALLTNLSGQSYNLP